MKNILTITIVKNESDWMDYTYMCDAAKLLNGAAFKLYIYFCYCTPDTTETYSHSHFANEFGGGLTSARRAFYELIEKGYLRQDDNEDLNHYYFYRDTTKMV